MDFLRYLKIHREILFISEALQQEGKEILKDGYIYTSMRIHFEIKRRWSNVTPQL